LQRHGGPLTVTGSSRPISEQRWTLTTCAGNTSIHLAQKSAHKRLRTHYATSSQPSGSAPGLVDINL
jgi:hypothetical protein